MIPIGLTIVLLAILFIIIRLCISKELPVPTRVIVFVCATTALRARSTYRSRFTREIVGGESNKK